MGKIPVKSARWWMRSSILKSPSSRYISTPSSSFLAFLGRSTTTADQKCLVPVKRSSISDVSAPALHITSSAFLFNLPYVMSGLNKKSSIVSNGRCATISSIAFSPNPLMDVKGWIKVLPSSDISHTLPDELTFVFLILNPKDRE